MVDNNRGLGLGPLPPSASNFTGILGVANGGTGANLSATGGTGQYVKQASAGGVATVGVITTADLPNVIRLNAADNTAHAVSSGTAEVALKTFSFTVASMPAITAGSLIIVRTLWTYTNSSNVKTPRLRLGAAGAGLGGTALLAPTLTTSATMGRDVYIYVRATNSQLVYVPAAVIHENSSASAIGTAAIDLTANWEIVLSGQPASGGETIQLEAASVEIQIP